MGTKLVISNAKESFLQVITAVHFPEGGKPGPGSPQIVWIIDDGVEPNGRITFGHFDYPYGSGNVGNTTVPITTFEPEIATPTNAKIGYFDNTANAMTAVMTWQIDFTDVTTIPNPFPPPPTLTITTSGTQFFVGGYYASLADAQAVKADPANSGRTLTIIQTTINPVP